MTTPDATALQRPTYTISIEPHEPNDVMVVATMQIPGRAAPARFMGEPDVLEHLQSALSPVPVIHQVAALIQWAAGAMDNAGKGDEAAVARRLAEYILGNIPTPVTASLDEPLHCQHQPDDATAVCGAANARECTRCGKKWCVRHWNAADHTCFGNRVRVLPPPVQALPADLSKVVGTASVAAVTG